MTYKSIMVGLDLGSHSPGRVRVAASLADRFGARLIGVAARQPDYPRGYGETVMLGGYGTEEIRKLALDDLAGAERSFLEAAGSSGPREWRSDLKDPSFFLEEQSRAADLIVIGRSGRGVPSDLDGSFGAGAALVALGRPVLVVPPGIERLSASRIVVAWKNTLHTRRAISDAMPMLKRAAAVQVLTIAEGGDRKEIVDVADYLGLHGVEALPVQGALSGDSVAASIGHAVEAFGADLVVSGAYGHSRVREWFFGGVTQALLERSPICCLMSH